MQFAKYFVLALVALLTNLISRHFLGFYISFLSSVIVAYILGHFVNFALSARYIFPRNISLQKAFVKFSLVALAGLIAASVVSLVALHILNQAKPNLYGLIESSPFLSPHIEFLLHQKHLEFVAHISGVGASFVLNFLGHKFFSFKDTGTLEKFKSHLKG